MKRLNYENPRVIGVEQPVTPAATTPLTVAIAELPYIDLLSS